MTALEAARTPGRPKPNRPKKTTKKVTPGAGWAWYSWLDFVAAAAAADLSSERPNLYAIRCVAADRALFCTFATGANCRPSRSNLAKRNGIDTATVLAVDKWLQARGFITFVRKTKDNVAEFVLRGSAYLPLDGKPVGRHEGQPVDALVGRDDHQPHAVVDGPVGRVVGRVVGRHDGHDPQPSILDRKGEDEEEEVGANAPPSKLALRIVREAIKRSQPLDADKVAEAVDVFMAANSEWSIDPIVAFIVDRANTATSNPTAFVVGALKRPPSTMKLSPKVRAFRLLDHLNEVEGAIEDIDPDGYEEFSEANGAIALEADTGDLTLAEFLHAADTLQIRDFSKRIETAIAVGQCRLAQLLRPRSPLTEDDF